MVCFILYLRGQYDSGLIGLHHRSVSSSIPISLAHITDRNGVENGVENGPISPDRMDHVTQDSCYYRATQTAGHMTLTPAHLWQCIMWCSNIEAVRT